jgi:hypothetical protein
MPNSDWLPAREQDLEDLCQRWKLGLGNPVNVTAFGWKQVEVDEVLVKVDAFLIARAAYKDTDSTRNRMTKDDARDAAKRAMRDFANTSIRYNRLMEPADKLVYGIHDAEYTSTPVRAPRSYPEAEADTSIIRQITIRFWDSVTKKRGKPHGVHGAEIRWAFLDHNPVSENELVNSDFETASPLTLKFDESDRGRRLYFCLRWESTTNLKGPFGEFYSVVIP